MNPESPWLRGALVVAIVAVLQEAVFRGLRLDGIRPDLLLGVGVLAGVVGDRDGGAVLAFVAALTGDLFVDTPFGLSALAACSVAYLAGSIMENVRPGERRSVPILTALGSGVAVGLFAVVGSVLGLPGLLAPRLLVIMAVVGGVNGLLSLPFGRPLRWVFAGVSHASTGLAA